MADPQLPPLPMPKARLHQTSCAVFDPTPGPCDCGSPPKIYDRLEMEAHARRAVEADRSTRGVAPTRQPERVAFCCGNANNCREPEKSCAMRGDVLGREHERGRPGGVTRLDPVPTAERICRDVAELPDRNSPKDWPEAMLVTHDELRAIVLDALGVALPDGAKHG